LQKTPPARRQEDEMKVEELMIRDVATIHPDRPIAAAAELMRGRDVGCLAVVSESGRLMGLVTDRDIVVRNDAYGRDTYHGTVGQIMTKDCVSCYGDENIAAAVEAMLAAHVRRLPVIRRGDRKLIGILSIDDVADHHDLSEKVGRLVHDHSHAAA
jgi:CBS domain-containing protein